MIGEAKMHTLTRTGLAVLGISAIIGILSFGVVAVWSNSFGNFLGMAFGSQPPPHIILCYFGTAGGAVGAIVGVILALFGAANNTTTGNTTSGAPERSDRQLVKSNGQGSEGVILCKNCSAIFSADSKGKKCDHCGSVLR